MRIIPLVLVLCAVSCLLSAKPAIPITRVSTPPIIDAAEYDPVWEAIEPLPQPVVYLPHEGDELAQRTEARLAYDNNWLYLQFTAWCDPANLKVTVSPREAWSSDDQVAFALDVYNSERDSYQFNFNAYGNPKDWLNSITGASEMNWNIPLRSAGRIYSQYYIVEVAIPFSSLSFDSRLPEQRWGFYYFRKDETNNQQAVYPPRSQDINSLLSQDGVLEGMRGIDGGHRIDLTPYLFGSYIDPGEKLDGDAGIDLETALTPQMLLSATLNPDFSQIEADAPDVDVNRLDPRQLSERRLFFTRGLNFFYTNQLNLLYTRKIVNPVAGVKVSGKYPNFCLGYLSALDEGIDGSRHDLYEVFRFRHDVFSQSTIGTTLTSVDDLDNHTWNRVTATDLMFSLPPYFTAQLDVAASFDHPIEKGDTETGYGSSGNFHFENELVDASSWFTAYTDEYEPGAGYLSPRRKGVMNIGASDRQILWRNGNTYNNIQVYGGTSSDYELDYNPIRSMTWAGFIVDWKNRLSTQIEFKMYNDTNNWLQGDTEQERIFRYNEVNLTTSRYWSSLLDTWWNLSTGSTPWYGDSIYDPGFKGWYIASDTGCHARPFDRLSVDITASAYDLHTDWQGDRKFAYVTLWNKWTLLISQGVHVRDIIQGQRVWMEYPRYEGVGGWSSTQFSNSLLVSWEYCPLSNIYAGCNFVDFNRWDNLTENLQLFAKINYLWTL